MEGKKDMPLKTRVNDLIKCDGSTKCTEDPSLTNWRKWVRIHRKQQKNLGEALNRPPQCLVMNRFPQIEKTRDQWLFDKARKFATSDKLQGSDFWMVDQTLKPQLWDQETGPVTGQCFGHYQKPTLRTKDYIAVPYKILEEKGIQGMPCWEDSMKRWNNLEYVKRTKKELENELNMLEPHKPELGELVTIGKSIPGKLFTVSCNIPKIVIEDFTNEEIDENHMTALEVSAGMGFYRIIEMGHPPTIKIGDTFISRRVNIFNYPNKISDIPLEWEITFVNVFTRKSYIKYIKIENVGPVAIRYKWKLMPLKTLTNDLPLRHTIHMLPKFYFMSSPGLILPGRINSLHAWLKSCVPGQFSETWELKTYPKVHNNKMYFHFEAVVTEEDIEGPWKSIDTVLDEAIAYKFARKAVITTRNRMYGGSPKGIPYSKLMSLEMETFLFTNPLTYAYVPDVVQTLKEMYKQLFSENWNLNVSDFYKQILQSGFEVHQLVNHIKIFNGLKMKLKEIPSVPKYDTRFQKYNAVYNILCMAIGKIEEAATVIRAQFNMQPVSEPPICKVETLLGEPIEAEAEYHIQIETEEQPTIKHEKKVKGTADKKGKKGTATSDKKGKKETASTGKMGKKSTKDSKPASDKSKKKGKVEEPKRKYIYLTETKAETSIIIPSAWEPENEEYGVQLYAKVYSILCDAVDSIEVVMEGRDWDHHENLTQIYEEPKWSTYKCP